MELVRAGAEGCLPVVPSPTESGMGVKPTWGAPAAAVMLGTAVAPPDPVGVSVGLKVPPGRAVGVRVAVGRVGAAVWVALGDTVARGVASIGTTSVEAGADIRPPGLESMPTKLLEDGALTRATASGVAVARRAVAVGIAANAAFPPGALIPCTVPPVGSPLPLASASSPGWSMGAIAAGADAGARATTAG